MATQLPQPFGKYLLLNKIAMGGMAEIFRAKTIGAEGFEKEVVIKRILPHFTEDEAFVTMFIDEAKVSSGLNHPNIVQVFDFDIHEGAYYIAMEYIEGKDLKRLMDVGVKAGTPMSVPQVVNVIMETCKGLHYAHTKKRRGQPLNIIHRDVSPHNVMVSYDGEVKVMDFGIAKAAQRSTKTRAGTVKGKCAYMSPEQARGKNLDPRSDMFAVGVMAWEMLTHRRLFAGDSDFETLSNVLKQDAPPPSSINPEVPPELDAILLKCLSKDREERQPDCKALARELEQWFYSHVNTPEDAELGPPMRALFSEDLAALREMQQGDSATQFLEASQAVRAQRGSSSSISARHSSSSVPAVQANDARTVALDLNAEQVDLNSDRTVAVDAATMAAGMPNTGQQPAQSKTGLYVSIIVALLVALGIGSYFLFFAPKAPPAEAPPGQSASIRSNGNTGGSGTKVGQKPLPEGTDGAVAESTDKTAETSGTEGSVAAQPTDPVVPTDQSDDNEPVEAKVTISAIPADAEVTARGESAKGKLTITATVGDVIAVIVKHPDYEQVIKEVKVNTPEKTVDVPLTQKKKPVEPKVVLAKMTFTVSPKDARLMINGQEQPSMAEGVYELSGYKLGEDISVEVDAKGYKTETETLRITVPELAKTYTLDKKATQAPSGPGKVKFQARPWANVSVKGKTCTTGTPACTMTLKSGRYTAVFSQAGKTKRKGFRVKPNKTVRVFVDMTK